MAAPVTTAGSFTCVDHGSPTLKSNAKLTVDEKPVLPFAVVATLGTYKDCKFANGPCTATTVVSGGSAGNLTVGGEPVLLDSIIANAGTPATPAAVTVVAGQEKLTTPEKEQP